MMRYDQKRGLWVFSDAIELSTSDIKVSEGKQAFMADSAAGIKDTLAVEMAITHSDFVNLNNRLYVGKDMADSVESWLKPYPKPVIRTHNISDEEPIGRMYFAEFRADSGIGVSENAHGVNREDILAFLNSYQPGNKPSGHIYAGFYVADKDAIEKWLDGRYQTVSVGFSTQDAFCSVCGANFAKMDMLEAGEHEHIPGENGCFIMVGKQIYEHLGVVNMPADEYTYVAKMKVEKQMYGDSIKPKVFITNNNKTFSLGDEAAKPMSTINSEPKEMIVTWPADAKLLLEATDAKQRTHYVTKEALRHTHRVILDPETGNGYASYAADHSHDVTANKIADSYVVRDWSAPIMETGEYPIKLDAHGHELGDQVEPLVDTAEIKYKHEFVCETDFSENDQIEALITMDDHYEEIANALIKEGTMAEDAKLSAAQRNKMVSSTFCGPGRSFPVNDCAHYTAALRLLNRFKGSEATKQKIHGCIMRKGKTLGCIKKDEVTAPVTPAQELPLDQVIARADVKAHILSLVAEKDAAVTSLQTKVTSLEAEVAKLQQELATAQAEVVAAKKDTQDKAELLTAVTDQNIRMYKTYKTTLVENIIIKSQLTNKGPIAEMLVPAAGETAEDKITAVRKRLSEESVEALTSKLQAIDANIVPAPAKLAPEDFNQGKATENDTITQPAKSEEKPDSIVDVFSR